MDDERRTRHVQHIPVLVEEVVMLLRCEPGQTYVDTTLGGGGHALEILKRTAPDGILIGVEWDGNAISEARKRLMPFGDRVKIFRENFIHLPDLLKAERMEQVDGILLDLGLSSIQLEKEERGFSFQGEGPLDMRMDQQMDRTAADLVNDLSPRELEYTLSEYGEERWAKRIAKAIVYERERGPIRTTHDLRRIVHQAIPRRFHSRKIDPATRTFQAFRIRVNDELENLRKILETGWRLLRKGGRMCVISFHSLEDRMVKEIFRKLERGGMEDSSPEGVMRVITKKPVTPSEEEQRRNPRSRSAKLRCAERV
jgi:16S rRNA (cytosine1402-N4)-methyltransferase